MKVTVKKGHQVVSKDGFSEKVLENKMAELLTEHKHICASCCSNDCKGKRTLDSPLIERGISTLGKTFVFDCKGYKKIETIEDTLLLERYASYANRNTTYQPTVYPISNDDVKVKVMRMY